MILLALYHLNFNPIEFKGIKNNYRKKPIYYCKL